MPQLLIRCEELNEKLKDSVAVAKRETRSRKREERHREDADRKRDDSLAREKEMKVKLEEKEKLANQVHIRTEVVISRCQFGFSLSYALDFEYVKTWKYTAPPLP